MIYSEGFPFVLRGEKAMLIVVRNNGECWGYVTFPQSGRQLYVVQQRDLYDYEDDEAAEMMIVWAKRGKTEPAIGSIS